jgi:squalene cyclase
VTSAQTVEDILYGSFDFVSSLQNENGSWEEFYLNSGLSNVWATGYVLFTLPKLEYRKDEHHRAACNFLLENRQKELWGYNTEWVPDTDSTTCVIMGLHCNGIDISSFVDKWFTWQHKIGGFSTYSCQDDLRKIVLTENNDFNGWLQPHTCVSAVAYYFLSLYKRTSVEFKQLESFLLSKIKNGMDSYWWTSPLYSWHYVIKGLNNSKSKNYYNLKQIISGLLARQNPDGSFGDSYQPSNSFYTSMLLSLLCSDKELFYKFKNEADKAFLWLAKNQYSDGSFLESTCLQVPSPDVINPRDVKNWKLGHTKTNIITKDFSRLFSSAQSCNAINQYSLLC